MASKVLDFYIDFTSPFTYLCNIKLPDLVAKYCYGLNYHPIDIPTAKLAAGNYGPSNRQVPAKIRALLQDLNRRGMTVVLVTHERDIASFASRVIGFRDGRVVDDKRNSAPADAGTWLQEHAAVAESTS